MNYDFSTKIIRMMATILVIAAMAGCGSDDADQSPPQNNVNNQAEDAGNDSSADPDTDVEPAQAEFEVGTNVVYENNPQSYTPMMDGAEVPLTFGVQGSWMVVLAFRSKNLLDGQFDVRADITIDGVESGDIWLEFQDTFPGGDGWDYYYNLFLAIDQNDPPARGTPARVYVSVEDQSGNFAEETYEVMIGEASGGP